MRRLLISLFLGLSLPTVPVLSGPAGSLPAFINEFSQGASSFKEWFEILVVQPGLDMRGWSAGDLDGGSYSPLVQFPDIPFWSSIPAGTLIVIYNGGDTDSVVAASGAPDTNIADYVLLINALDTNLIKEVGAWPNSGQFGNSNTDDTPALRDAQGNVVHNLAGAAGTPIIAAPGANQAVQYMGGLTNDVFDTGVWRYVTAGNATPGAANSTTNAGWITLMRAGSSNGPPLLYPPGNFTVREGFPLLFSLIVQPTDGDPVSLSASNLPPGSIFDASGTTGVFAWAEAGPIGVYTTQFFAADEDGVTSVVSVINVVTNPLEARFRSDWLWIAEGQAATTGQIEIILNKLGAGVVQIALSGTAAPQGDVLVYPTNLLFTAVGPTSQWITVVVQPDADVEGPEWLDLQLVPVSGLSTATPANAHVRIRDDDSFSVAAANLSSQVSPCNPQYVDTSRRLLRGISPDIVAIQEFKMSDVGGYTGFVAEVFGPGWYVTVETTNSSCDLPNGIISRWPITASGEWDDYELTDRDFAWATIDLPGTQDLHVISVHLKAGDTTDDRTRRENQARQLTNYVAQSGWPASDLIVLAGDLNQASRYETALAVLTNILSDATVPTDQLGDPDTNIPRSRPYDYILPNGTMQGLVRPLPFGGFIFSGGMVFDSRIWSPPPAPVFTSDSEGIGIQHLGVLKLFALPTLDNTDEDHDGLPDEWELQFFSGLETLNPTQDYDSDGLTDWEEYRAGTRPMDSNSLLRVTAVARTVNPHFEISWSSSSNRLYSLWRSDDLLTGFELIYSNLPATPPVNTVLDEPTESAPAWFYKIEVQ